MNDRDTDGKVWCDHCGCPIDEFEEEWEWRDPWSNIPLHEGCYEHVMDEMGE